MRRRRLRTVPMDGGARRGTDMFKALALGAGARAVLHRGAA
jgi:isopentenyl diphosphate isomerase/L-lactate dehydrogenase-like FMN-dependent dehydrogenase